MKDIKNYEGLYAITSCGRVWSYKNQRFITGGIDGSGYQFVQLYKDGVRQTCKVHRLVAEAYIPNPEGKPQVNHKDEVKTHNYINNLEWVTPQENVNYGSRSERAIKNTRKPIYCIELDRVFESGSQAAKELGLSAGNISNVLKGRYKSTGGYRFEYVKGDK